MEEWVFAIAAASALSAAIAAIASLLQVRSAAHANEVNVYLRLMEDYGAPDMRPAIATLAAFWRDRKDRFSDPRAAYDAEKIANPEHANILRDYCRSLVFFFRSAAELYNAGFISRRLLRLLISRPGLNVYYKVAVPILARGESGNTSKYADMLKRIVKRYREGLY